MCFLCQKGNIKICDRAIKLVALRNFVPLYISLTWTFLLPFFPGAVVVLENSVFQSFQKITIQITILCGYLNQRKET